MLVRLWGNATPRRRAALAAGLAMLCWLVSGGSAGAAAFFVNPIRADLSAKHGVAALTVTNGGAAPSVIQLEVLAWSQRDGQDVYLPSTELLATPPIFTVPAGASQIVRIGLRRAVDPRDELSYRVYLREVPAPPRPDFVGLTVALRMGVPVFVAPASGVASAALRWTVAPAGPGQVRLTVSNAGTGHAQITGFTLAQGAASAPLAQKKMLAYVLAGQQQSWLLPANPQGDQPLRLQVDADGARVDTELTLEKSGADHH